MSKTINEVGVFYTDEKPKEDEYWFWEFTFHWLKFSLYYETEKGSKTIWIITYSSHEAERSMLKLINHWNNKSEDWKYWL